MFSPILKKRLKTYHFSHWTLIYRVLAATTYGVLNLSFLVCRDFRVCDELIKRGRALQITVLLYAVRTGTIKARS